MKADGFELGSGPRTRGDGYYDPCFLGFEGNTIELTVSINSFQFVKKR